MTVTVKASDTASGVAGEAGTRAAAAAVSPRGERRVDADGTSPDIVDVWGFDSFPASDAPANW